MPSFLTEKSKWFLSNFFKGNGRLVLLTGAGISAESGIPTFRGEEGYWRVGSKNYTPQEIGTYAMFKREPEEVWKWFLFRRTVCQNAKPNPGHEAVVELERLLGDRFLLITQNVDGLHQRAGSSADRTYNVHGNLDYVRCGKPCSYDIFAFPDGIGPKTRESDITKEELDLLRCPYCGSLTRPHVLWFDETYNEEYFRYNSSHAAMKDCYLFITVGTSGATNLPAQLAVTAVQMSIPFIDINPHDNAFRRLTQETPLGAFLNGPSGEVLPQLVDFMKEKA